MKVLCAPKFFKILFLLTYFSIPVLLIGRLPNPFLSLPTYLPTFFSSFHLPFFPPACLFLFLPTWWMVVSSTEIGKTSSLRRGNQEFKCRNVFEMFTNLQVKTSRCGMYKIGTQCKALACRYKFESQQRISMFKVTRFNIIT